MPVIAAATKTSVPEYSLRAYSWTPEKIQIPIQMIDATNEIITRTNLKIEEFE